MTTAEVKATLGEPESIVVRDGVEVMSFMRCHANCAAKGVENRRHRTYEVRLINGVVDSATEK